MREWVAGFPPPRPPGGGATHFAVPGVSWGAEIPPRPPSPFPPAPPPATYLDTCADTPSASVNFASVIKTNGIYGVGGGGEAGGHGFRSLIAGAVGVFGVGGVQKIAAPNFTARLLFFVTICVARRRGIKNPWVFGISPGGQLYCHAAPPSKPLGFGGFQWHKTLVPRKIVEVNFGTWYKTLVPGIKV